MGDLPQQVQSAGLNCLQWRLAPSPVVSDDAVLRAVCANFVPALAGADLAPLVRGGRGRQTGVPQLLQAPGHFHPRLAPVVGLRAGIDGNGDAGRAVGEDHAAVGLVPVLATWSGGALKPLIELSLVENEGLLARLPNGNGDS